LVGDSSARATSRTRIIAAINTQPDSRVVAVMSRDLSRAETFAREFNAAVRGEGEPAADGEDGMRSLQIALTVRESAMTGKRITLE
jgi:1,5-anhydro-D-fructose reductase (1,5-anhydro-D-mannitol-forming)